MKIKLDENLPRALEDLLVAGGHDVTTVPQEALGGSNDPRVLNAATGEDRLLMTFDLDFADIRQYPVGSHAGVVVFRLHDQRWSVLEQPVRRLLTSGTLQMLGRGLAIVDEVRAAHPLEAVAKMTVRGSIRRSTNRTAQPQSRPTCNRRGRGGRACRG